MSLPRRVLAIASGGGHWVQLQLAVAGLGDHEVTYATVNALSRQDVGDARFFEIPDATRWNKLALVRVAWAVLRLLVRERPEIVISTGAAPGFFAIVIGKLLGMRTVWIDSVANAERLSGSGRYVRPFADLWLTQWPHLARPTGPEFRGAVL